MSNLTPSSSSTSYLSNSEMILLYDQNLIGKLVSDTNTSVQPSDLPTNTTLSAILQGASGMVESAALVGGRYGAGDLTTLVTPDGNGKVPNGGMMIKRLVADLAMGMLRQRRGMVEDQPYSPYVNALRQLELLRSGETILPFVEAEEAGQAKTTQVSPYQQWEQGRLTSRLRRFFGYRYDQDW